MTGVQTCALPISFDDDVGVRLEQADDLLVGGDCLALKNATRGLGDDPLDQRTIVGLSGILCMRLISSLSDEPFAEDDGELGLGLEPLSRRPLPFLRRVVENEI